MSETNPNTLRRGSLSDLAARLERLKATTHDYVVDARSIQMRDNADLGWGWTPDPDGSRFAPATKHAHNQLSEKLGIPFRYYERMQQEQPQLLARNVNTWLSQRAERQMIRVADGHVRAVLSDRYRALDNYDLALTLADQAISHQAEVLECSLSETHMAVKLTVPRYREEVLKGDTVVPGILVTNSEVGAASFRVEAFVWRLVCKNGLVIASAFRQIHVGAKLELGEVSWADDTRQFEDGATWRKVRDIVGATFSGEGKFKELVRQLRASTEVGIAKPMEVTDTLAKNLSLSDDRKASLLRYFSREGDTLYGLVNGITRLAQDAEDPIEQVELERYAGDLLTKPVAALTA